MRLLLTLTPYKNAHRASREASACKVRKDLHYVCDPSPSPPCGLVLSCFCCARVLACCGPLQSVSAMLLEDNNFDNSHPHISKTNAPTIPVSPYPLNLGGADSPPGKRTLWTNTGQD